MIFKSRNLNLKLQEKQDQNMIKNKNSKLTKVSCATKLRIMYWHIINADTDHTQSSQSARLYFNWKARGMILTCHRLCYIYSKQLNSALP